MQKTIRYTLTNLNITFLSYRADLAVYPHQVACDMYYEIMSTPEGIRDWLEADKIIQAYYNRLGRIKKRVKIMTENPCVFLTLTFNDDVMASTDFLPEKSIFSVFSNPSAVLMLQMLTMEAILAESIITL